MKMMIELLTDNGEIQLKGNDAFRWTTLRGTHIGFDYKAYREATGEKANAFSVRFDYTSKSRLLTKKARKRLNEVDPTPEAVAFWVRIQLQRVNPAGILPEEEAV